MTELLARCFNVSRVLQMVILGNGAVRMEGSVCFRERKQELFCTEDRNGVRNSLVSHIHLCGNVIHVPGLSNVLRSQCTLVSNKIFAPGSFQSTVLHLQVHGPKFSVFISTRTN